MSKESFDESLSDSVLVVHDDESDDELVMNSTPEWQTEIDSEEFSALQEASPIYIDTDDPDPDDELVINSTAEWETEIDSEELSGSGFFDSIVLRQRRNVRSNFLQDYSDEPSAPGSIGSNSDEDEVFIYYYNYQEVDSDGETETVRTRWRVPEDSSSNSRRMSGSQFSSWIGGQKSTDCEFSSDPGDCAICLEELTNTKQQSDCTDSLCVLFAGLRSLVMDSNKEAKPPWAGQLAALKLSCGHNYHRDCLRVWFTQGRAACPLCREEVPFSATNRSRVMPEIDVQH